MCQFKKQNIKQRAYSNRLVGAAKTMLIKRFLVVLLLTIAIPTGLVLAQDSNSTESGLETLLTTGGVTMASMGFIGNVEDVGDFDTQGGQIAYEIRLVELPQVDRSVPFPKANSNREVGTIALNTGEYMYSYEAHDLPTLTYTGEKGDITIDAAKEFTIVMGGLRKQLLNFIETKGGCKFIILFRKVETEEWYMLGSLDKPMIFSGYEGKLDKEATAVTCKFKNSSMKQLLWYVGAIVDQSPKTVAAGAISLAIDSNSRYQLSDHSTSVTIASMTGVAEADHNRHITILGSGGTNPPKIADNSTFILKDGAQWTANGGSSIIFKIMDNTTLVEVDRVQTS